MYVYCGEESSSSPVLTLALSLPAASVKVKLYIHTTENRVSPTNDNEDAPAWKTV